MTAAGNRAGAPDAVSYSPANDPFVITVGGVDDQGSKATADALAPWSSYGTTQDGVAKPDLVAPAAHMVAPPAPNSSFLQLCRGCVRDNRDFQVGGTSMASPVVAGIVADLLQVHPDWTPDQVKQALVSATRPTLGDAREVAADLTLKARPRNPTVNAGLTPAAGSTPGPGRSTTRARFGGARAGPRQVARLQPAEVARAGAAPSAEGPAPSTLRARAGGAHRGAASSATHPPRRVPCSAVWLARALRQTADSA